jgi:hypothetical protein
MTGPPSGRDPLEEVAEEFLTGTARASGRRWPRTPAAAPTWPTASAKCSRHSSSWSRSGRRPRPTAGPDRLGEYGFVREDSRGGMGVEYEAVQESLGRRATQGLARGPRP